MTVNSFSGSRSPLTKFLCFKSKLSNCNDDITGWPRLATQHVNRNSFGSFLVV